MVAGTIIGASIFVQPAEITSRVPSVAGILLVWVGSGILTLFGALVCAELASAFPESGGVYVFLKRAFSPALGFLWGWAMFWSMHSGIIAAIAVVFARYVAYFVPLDDTGIRLVAIARGRGALGRQLRGGPPGRPAAGAVHHRQGRRDRRDDRGRFRVRIRRNRGRRRRWPGLVDDRARRLCARAHRGTLCLRRLAHGDLLSRRDREPASNDSRLR